MQSNSGKAQSSVEYSIIYSLGVVVIILALIIAWRMETFTPETPLKGNAGFSQLKITDHAAYLNSSRLVLAVRNDVGNDIEVTRADANIVDIYCYNSSPITMTPGMKTIADLRCSDLSNDYVEGAYYRANVTINYTNLETGNIHYSKGMVWGGVE